MANNNRKKNLVEQLKAKLNSPDYVAMPDLITYDDRYGDLMPMLYGVKKDGNIHKRGNWISSLKEVINPNPNDKFQSKDMVFYDELDPNDWEEIVNLIKKKNQEKEQIFENKRHNIKDKLNDQSNLYYYWGSKSTSWVNWKGMRGYVRFWGEKKDSDVLYIAENHPILNDFSFQVGFYLINTDKPAELIPAEDWSEGEESNPKNFKKFVEVGDEITIASYEIRNEPLKNPKEKDDSKERSFLGKAENEKEIIGQLIKLFQQNNIKQISLGSDGDLVIKENNNKTICDKKILDDNQILKNYLQRSDESIITEQSLKHKLDSLSVLTTTQPTDSNPALLIGGGLIIGLWLGFLILFKRIHRKRVN